MKVLWMVFMGVMMVLLCGCDLQVEETLANSDLNRRETIDKAAVRYGNESVQWDEIPLVEIVPGLYYDQHTNIVYFWNGFDYRFDVDNPTPVPYYAPNGIPYRYNLKTNSLEEIKQ